MITSFRKADLRDKAIDITTYNTMVEWVRKLSNMGVDQNMTLDVSDSGILLGIRPGVGGGLDLDSTVCFGYDLDPDGDNDAEVVVYSGEMHHGARGIIDTADTKIVLTADHQYVWLEYVKGSGSATIAGPSTSRPVSDAATGTFRKWLYMFRLISGVASLERVGLWNVDIPGSFA